MPELSSSGDTAALMQAHFLALLHNLLTVLLARLEHTGLQETKVIDRQQKRRDKIPPDKQVPAHNNVRHAFALTCQFIRTVRNAMLYRIPWEDAYPLFKQRMESYL